MTKRAASSSGTEVASKVKKSDEQDALRTSLQALSKEVLVEKCLKQTLELDRLSASLKKSQKMEQLSRIRYTIKDKEHRAMAQEQSTARWKLLGDPSNLLIPNRGVQVEAFVQDAFTTLRDETLATRRDVDAAKKELASLRGKASEENKKEWERIKKMKDENEKMRIELKKKVTIEKELAIAQKAAHLYKQKLKDNEKELAERNARIRLLEEEPKAEDELEMEDEEEEEVETAEGKQGDNGQPEGKDKEKEGTDEGKKVIDLADEISISDAEDTKTDDDAAKQ